MLNRRELLAVFVAGLLPGASAFAVQADELQFAGLDRVEFYVGNVDKSRDFFVNIFGSTLKNRNGKRYVKLGSSYMAFEPPRGNAGQVRVDHFSISIKHLEMPKLHEFQRDLPPGYRMEIVGELKEQIKGQKQSLSVVIASVLAIYLALVFQFKNAFKPLIVFAGIPFGAVGALAGVWIMNMAMGFMVILGITSLIGIIVSHVIVLFDFIEERHANGEPLRDALIDAGILRIRPVLITVGATVLALFPLALHGGPLWEALCYAQIGGLAFATTVTLFIVPVVYSIFVLDLKIIRWEVLE